MSHVTIVALAWALVHFAWQGAAIALTAGLVDAALRRARPATRYAVLCAALGAMVLAPAVTFLALRLPQAAISSQVVAVAAPVVPSLSAATVPAASPSSSGPLWLDWVVPIWLAGMAVLGARSVGGWMWAQHLKRYRTSPAALFVQRAAIDLRERLGIRRAVRILCTTAAEVPATLGWLRPVVLVPVGALTSLTPEQIELLIAHELAHVRRHDYLVNLLQTAIETVLFYHPAVWWVSGKIRAERENCCDDLAVAACGNVVLYAETLASLEGLRGKRPRLAAAADGGSLVRRIRRLVGHERGEALAPPAWLGALGPAAAVLVAVLSVAPPSAAVFVAVLASEPPPAAAAGPRSRPVAAGTSSQPIAESASQPVAERASQPFAEPTSQPVAGPTSQPVAGPAPQPLDGPPSTPAAAEAALRPAGAGAAAGFLGELTASGYPKLSVDEIIALKEHGVEPREVKDHLSAGLGVPDVEQLIRLHEHGVAPGFVASMVRSGLVSDLDFANVIDLRENDARGDDMARIRALVFGPFSARDVIRLRQHGVDAGTFAALEEAGVDRAEAADAVEFRLYDVTTDRIRDMKKQGFHGLGVKQILDLRRAGVI